MCPEVNLTSIAWSDILHKKILHLILYGIFEMKGHVRNR